MSFLSCSLPAPRISPRLVAVVFEPQQREVAHHLDVVGDVGIQRIAEPGITLGEHDQPLWMLPDAGREHGLSWTHFRHALYWFRHDTLSLSFLSAHYTPAVTRGNSRPHEPHPHYRIFPAGFKMHARGIARILAKSPNNTGRGNSYTAVTSRFPGDCRMRLNPLRPAGSREQRRRRRAQPSPLRPLPPRARPSSLKATGTGDPRDFVTVVPKGTREGSY